MSFSNQRCWVTLVIAGSFAAITGLGVDHRRETAMNHALAVERHLVFHHARVGHRLGPALVAGLLRGPFHPREDDGLAVLRLHRAPEIGDLAVGYVVAPAIDHAGGAAFLHDRR